MPQVTQQVAGVGEEGGGGPGLSLAGLWGREGLGLGQLRFLWAAPCPPSALGRMQGARRP